MLDRLLASTLTLALAGPPEASEPVSAEPEPALAELVPPPPTLPPPPAPLEPDPINFRLVVAGDVLIGLGGAGLIAMIVGLGIRYDAINQRSAQVAATEPDQSEIDRHTRRISTGSALALAGGVTAATLMVTGIGLLAGGHARERRRRQELLEVGNPVAWAGREGAGLGWSLRF